MTKIQTSEAATQHRQHTGMTRREQSAKLIGREPGGLVYQNWPIMTVGFRGYFVSRGFALACILITAQKLPPGKNGLGLLTKRR